MEVLKRGSGSGKWSANVECTGRGNTYDNAREGRAPCGAKLKISLSDIFTTSHTYIDGSTDHYFTIKCPICGCLTDIDRWIVPGSFSDYASKTDDFTL